MQSNVICKNRKLKRNRTEWMKEHWVGSIKTENITNGNDNEHGTPHITHHTINLSV